jgi:tetratricopeptide (TPR) repeat protein
VGIIVLGVVLKAVTGKSNITIGGDPEPIGAIGCRPAQLHGLAPAPGRPPAPLPPSDGSSRFDLGRAIGVGACARLATEVGVEWNVADAVEALSVSAGIGEGVAEVKLEIAGKRGQGKGATPLDAVIAAVDELSKQLRARPPDEERTRAWGARDAESARRIERVWRRMVLALMPSYEQEVNALIESDGDSPWPHVFAALIGLPGAESSSASRARARERLDKLPPARSALLSGLFLLQDKPSERVEALRLLRQAYGQAPDDADVAGIYAAVVIGLGATDEGFAVVDRIVTRHPTRSMLAINNALSGAAQPDVSRDRRLLERLWATLPESAAWSNSMKHLLVAGDNAEARAALEFGTRLGMGSDSAFRVGHDYAAAMLELADLRPAAARERAAAVLGDPSLSSAVSGTRLVMASYHLEGRITDAEAAALREMERQKSNGSPVVAARLALRLARISRWLGRPAPPEEQLTYLEKTLADRPEEGSQASLGVRCEVALLRLTADPKRHKAAAERTLVEAEAVAERDAHGDRMFRDAGLLGTLSLVRALRGDAAAAKRWQETDRAPHAARRNLAYEAGLALEGAGQPAEAEKAYLLAQDPSALDHGAFERMAAEIRLSRLYRAQGRLEDANRREELVRRLWAGADAGVRDALSR